MGLISGTRDDDPRAIDRREHGMWTRLLAPGEQVHKLRHVGSTVLIFTNRRLVVVEEGLAGRNVEYLSVPYRSVTCFSVTASGAFGAEADLRIWVAGRTQPIEKAFGPGVDVYDVQALLTQHITA